ncbi:hypothetical protein PGTUg99_001583 [Puccinia graminis f. sp. tritici]|uniref:Uncharacterized protein n=1 Tax=Puccinia graminis f. sp. tritici TaxID=56615 RepID=A0A5B0QY94_PUCGR|nr:hypothetical protein PGTUg99_001741 [Puccinia graminis f. sp. tritici]KAA1118291.1 hypothetical protein PGTUg99_001583 [Puccinia graminis f. sp. tritici]
MQGRLFLLFLPLAHNLAGVTCYRSNLVRRAFKSHVIDLDDSWASDAGLTSQGDSNFIDLSNHLETGSMGHSRDNTPQLLELFPLTPHGETTAEKPATASEDEETRPEKRLRRMKSHQYWYSEAENYFHDTRQQHSAPSSSTVPPRSTPGVQIHDSSAPTNEPEPEELQPEIQQQSTTPSAVPPMLTPTRVQIHESVLAAHQHQNPWAGHQSTLPAPLGLNWIPTTHAKLAKALQIAPYHKSTKKPAAKGFTHSESSPMRPFQTAEMVQAETPQVPLGSPHLPTNEYIKRYYSCQILDWNPPEIIDQKAALGAHVMAIELQNLVEGEEGVYLNKLQVSHKIYNPFVYKLMTKDLNTNHWARVRQAWGSFWDSRFKQKTPQNILRKFIWVTDLITESTIPELFENERLEYTQGRAIHYRYHFTNHEAKLIKLLSDGRIPMKKDSNLQRATTDTLNYKFKSTPNLGQNGNSEELLAVDAVRDSILERLKSHAQVINGAISDITAAAPQWDPIDWTNSSFRRFIKDNLIFMKTKSPQPLPDCIPSNIQPQITQIARAANSIQKKARASLSSSNQSLFVLVSNFDGFLKAKEVQTIALPKVIHDYFEESFQRLKTSNVKEIIPTS